MSENTTNIHRSRSTNFKLSGDKLFTETRDFYSSKIFVDLHLNPNLFKFYSIQYLTKKSENNYFKELC